MAIDKLVNVPNNDFKTNEIIDPEQFDQNFSALVAKVDEIIDSIDGLIEPTSENIDVLPFATLTASVTLEEGLQYYYDKLQSAVDGDSGGNFVKITPIVGLTADDVQEALEEINAKTEDTVNLDGLYINKTNVAEYIPTANYHPCTKKYADSILTTFPYVQDDYAQFVLPAGLYNSFDFDFAGAIPLEPFIASFSDSINECIFSCHCKQADKVHMIIHNPTAIDLALVANTVRITKLAGIGSDNNGGGGGNVTEYILLFVVNGAEEGSAIPALVSLSGGEAYTITGVGNMVNDGYTFYGWNTRADGTGQVYLEGSVFIMPAINTHLYAMWTLSVVLEDFVMEIDTRNYSVYPSPSDTIGLYFINPGLILDPLVTPDAIIEWGDGNSDALITYGYKSHVYDIPGIYDIRIIGKFGAMTFDYYLYSIYDAKKITKIKQWGSNFNVVPSCLKDCINLTTIGTDQPNVQNSTAYMFANCVKLNSPINWDVPNLIYANQMFSGCTLFNSNIFLNNSKISNGAQMFINAVNFNKSITGIGLDIDTTGDKLFSNMLYNTAMDVLKTDETLNYFALNSGNFVTHKALGLRSYTSAGIPSRDLLYQKGWDLAVGFCIDVAINFTYDSPAPYQIGDTVIITAHFNAPAKLRAAVPTMQISCSGAQFLGFENMINVDPTTYTYSLLITGTNGLCTLQMNLGIYGVCTTTNNTFTIQN